MKVLGIVCSPRRRGNTEIMVKEALAGAEEAGAEVELVTVAGNDLAPCDGRGSHTEADGQPPASAQSLQSLCI